MLSLDQARASVLSAASLLPTESVGVDRSIGRFVSESLTSQFSLPAQDNSSVDGYAVRAEDLVHATTAAPVELVIAGSAPPGRPFEAALPEKSCVRIFTGSPIPLGATAVVMQEDVRAIDDRILFSERIEVGEGIRFHGDDIASGTRYLTQGDRISVGAAGLAGAFGMTHLTCHRKPRIAVLATGSELLHAGEARRAGHIFESNRLILTSLIEGAGGVVEVSALVRDELQLTRNAMTEAFDHCDVVITSGGVSVGDFDFIKPAFKAAGGHLDVWRVAIRPGKPFAFGRFGEKLLFGLPGNPIAAVVTFLLLVRPVLLKMQGARNVDLPRLRGRLATTISNTGTRHDFLRVRMLPDGTIASAGRQDSHVLSSLSVSSGLLGVPAGITYPAGAEVEMLLWDPVNL